MKPPFRMTEADLERAREIVAAPVLGKCGELADHIVIAVAQGIAEGRQQGMTPKRPRDPNQLAKSIIDIAKGGEAATLNSPMSWGRAR